MGAYKITEQQFRVRRRDRRMVWVDAVAFAIGLLIVAAGVGGVILIEPTPQPIEWRYAFIEARHEDRQCVGFTIIDAERVGCDPPLQEPWADEGVAIPGSWSPDRWSLLSRPNITSVTFELSWIEEFPVTTSPDCDEYCNRQFEYNESSVDTLRLEVTTPWGDTHVNESANEATSPYGGRGRITIPITEHEPGTITTFTREEAEARLNESYYHRDHGVDGEWTFTVTILDAGDIEGTVPINACAYAGGHVGMENDTKDLSEECDVHEEWQRVGNAPRVGWYSVYQDFLGPAHEPLPYTSTYKDPGNSWILSMVVRTYEANVDL